MASLPVSVNITRNTSAVNRSAFGYPLFVTETVPASFSAIRVKSYSDLAGMVTDGFATTDSAYLAAQSHFSQNPAPSLFYVGKKLVGDASISETMQEIQAEDDSWYFVLMDTDVEADVLAMAAWVESQTKMFCVFSDDAGNYGTYTAGSNTDLIGQLHDLGYDRTIGGYHHEGATGKIAAGVIASNATYAAGSVSWNFLDVAGVGISKNSSGFALTSTESQAVESRYCNVFQNLAGQVRMVGGRFVSGESIAVIRGIDNLQDDLQKSLLDLLLNQRGSKLAFSTQDIAKVEAVMRQVLSRYAARGFIFDDFTVSVPSASSVSDADKVAGVLNNVTFTASLQGAIDKITISGSVTY